MFTSAPPPLILPISEHGVPSAFTHGGGGGGSAIAAGASEIAPAATPMNSAGVIFKSFIVMQFGYHGRGSTKPLAGLIRRSGRPARAAATAAPAPAAPTASSAPRRGRV